MKRSFLMLSCLPLLMRAPGGEKETSETSGVTGTNAVTLSGMFAESRNLSTESGAPYDPAADENLVPVEGKNGQTVYVSPESAEHILNKRLERELRWDSRSVGDYGLLDGAPAPEVPAAPAPEPVPDPKPASKVDAQVPPAADPAPPAPIAEGELKPLAPDGAATEPATKTNKPAKPAK